MVNPIGPVVGPGPAVIFGQLNQAPMSNLDTMFQNIGQSVVLSCVNNTSNSNNISLVASVLDPAVTAYFNYLRLQFQVIGTTTGPVSVQFSGLAFLPVFKPDGTQAGSGDLVDQQIYDLAYVSSYGTSGGWVIMNAGTATAGVSALADALHGGLSFSAASGSITASLAPGDLNTKNAPVPADTIISGDSAALFAVKAVPYSAYAQQMVTVITTTSPGTNGAALTSGTYQTRVLTSKTDPQGLCTLVSNQLVFATTAVWDIYGYTSAACTGGSMTCQTRLRDITSSTTLLHGGSQAGPISTNLLSMLQGIATITAGDTIAIQTIVNVANCIEGQAAGVGVDGAEQFLAVTFRRIG